MFVVVVFVLRYCSILFFSPKCCCVSVCGNFTVIGTSTGDIEVFNIQSGRRQRAVIKGQYRPISCFSSIILCFIIKGHKGPIRGVATNDLNSEVYSCGADGTIKVTMERSSLHV